MVHDLILEARTQRGPSCVQVLEQFELLCGYANKLVTEGPLETPNIVETLTDPNRIATTQRALEVIHSIANRTATVTEQKLLTSALKIVAEALQHAEIKDPEVRTRLDEELETINSNGDQA